MAVYTNPKRRQPTSDSPLIEMLRRVQILAEQLEALEAASVRHPPVGLFFRSTDDGLVIEDSINNRTATVKWDAKP